jgi:hemerythrin-like domain-containing protein
MSAMQEEILWKFDGYATTEIRGVLREDHQHIRELASELAATDSAARRKVILDELKPLLISHARAEEAAVYVALMGLENAPDARLAGAQGTVEHHMADLVIERLVYTPDTDSDMWRAHAKVLHESLERHICEEEVVLFDVLGEHFSEGELEAMARQFELTKKRLLKPAMRAVPLSRVA